VAEYYSEYKQCFEGAGTNPGEKTLEDKFFEYEVLLIRGTIRPCYF
jgi:V-type H+-transporting ATPase subunit d